MVCYAARGNDGQNFNEVLEYCRALVEQLGLHFLLSIDGDLIRVVAHVSLWRLSGRRKISLDQKSLLSLGSG